MGLSFFKNRFGLKDSEASVGVSKTGGARLLWERYESQYDDLKGVRALLPGTDSYAEYSPCKCIAPTVHLTVPQGNGSFRMRQVYIWDTPETVVDMAPGSIKVRGIRQILDSIDEALSNDVEDKYVSPLDGIQVLDCKDFDEWLKANGSIGGQLEGTVGIEDVDQATIREIHWGPIFYDGEVVGNEAVLSDGVSVLRSYPTRFMCPRITCLQRDDLRSGDCYAWDTEIATLKDPDGNAYEAMGLKQLCEKKGLDIVEELQQHAYSYLGLAVIPKHTAAVIYHEASGEMLNLIGGIGGLYGD